MEGKEINIDDMSIAELKDALIEQNEKANFLIDQFNKAATANKDAYVEDLKTMYAMVKTQHDAGYTGNTPRYNENIQSMMGMMTELIIIED
jgi:hypothetical protein